MSKEEAIVRILREPFPETDDEARWLLALIDTIRDGVSFSWIPGKKFTGYLTPQEID